jgi:hypothetical protein
VEYIQDPDTLIPDQPQWRVYFPDNPVLTNLYAIYGERAYLIKLGGSQETVTWTVTGEPRLPRIKWKPDSFNFVGFHLDPDNEPFFEEFFESSSAHTGQEIYILNEQGDWQLVADPALTEMQQGEAFWVYCKGHSEFQGPLSIILDQASGLNFGAVLTEQHIRFWNLAAAKMDISLDLTGNAPLSYWRFVAQDENVGWRDFPMGMPLDPNETQTLRVGARRSGLTPNEVYESNLIVSDGTGSRVLIPVSVEGISHAGLWVGVAILKKVSEPRVAPDQDFPLQSLERSYDVGTPFSFRLILHVDENGQVRLLRQVIQMWDDTLGRFVLFTDDAKVSESAGTDLKGSQIRRISSAPFGTLSPTAPHNEVIMAGAFSEADGSLSCTISLAHDHPENPFVHHYHPDHKPKPAYSIIREIQMIFSSEDADGKPITALPVLTYGGTDMGGIYRETITGLHRTPIKVEGVFLLRKICSVAILER